MNDEKQQGFFKIPNDIFDLDLNPYQLSILAYLLRCSNNGSTAFPSYKTIGIKTGMSRDKAMRTIKELEEKGYIKKIVRKTDYADNDTNIYQVVFNSHYPSSQERPPLVDNSHYPSSSQPPNKELNNNNHTYKEPITKPEEDVDYVYVRRGNNIMRTTKALAEFNHWEYSEV